ncbi:MAG: hypothetical protein KDA91_19695 [Planctomycetaceae bacterium]|nr:hypothetical protein [Planctomycetaceae bacterium]
MNPLNEKLRVVACDNPQYGIQCAEYKVFQFDHPDHIMLEHFHFQRGSEAYNGVNGITNEVLLAIVQDRLKGYQAGLFACRENALALTKIEEALMWLHYRSRDRLARGVEGTDKA